jgi:hypothetical protein
LEADSNYKWIVSIALIYLSMTSSSTSSNFSFGISFNSLTMKVNPDS